MVMVRGGTTEGCLFASRALTCPVMRRPQSVFGLVAVMSSLLVVTLFAAPASAAFAPVESEAAPVFSAKSASCTKWRSSLTPPRTIRVLRTKSTDAPKKVVNTVQEVDFHEYVATVMAAEWPERYPLETLKAGAVATKQFAWYYILNPRGQTKWVDGEKVCYDVVDTTVDQAYYPEKHDFDNAQASWPKTLAALDVTWDVSVRKFRRITQSSRFFLTGYRAGSSGAACGEDATGFKLFHNSTRKCGYDGLKYREILRLYLKPNLEIVEPGRNDVIGSKHGDASAMEKDAGQFHSHVWTPGKTPPEPGSSTDVSVSNNDLVGYRSADMDGDGREDLVWLRQTGAHTGKIKVALSNGVDYQPAEDWWVGDTVVPLGPARLLLGDFHADHRVDVAILSRGDSPSKSKLVVLKRKKYASDVKFFGPTVWWSGSQDPSKIASAWAADMSGDGRADLMIRQNIESGGVKVRTAVTISPLPSVGLRMGGIRTRFESRTLNATKVKMTVGDANRDGREDLILLIGGGGRAKVERLQGALMGGFKRVQVWTAPKADPGPVEKTRLGASDVDYDGRTDLVLFTDRGGGTRIRVLKSRYDKMVQGPDWKVGIPWSDIRPY